MDEIDKGVSHVAPVFVVNGQVEEVVLSFMGQVDGLDEHCLGVFVRNVLYHYCRSAVLIVEDLGYIKVKA